MNDTVSRCYSNPIPATLMDQFLAAGLSVEDNDHSVTVYDETADKVGAVWGPTVDGAWCVYRTPGHPVRVESRDAGLEYILDQAVAR